MTKEELKQRLLNLNIVKDNEYLDKYCELILNNLDSPKVKYKTQVHHTILVNYYQTKYNLSNYDKAKIVASKDPNNILVNLTHEKHFWAHYYAIFCFTGKYSGKNAKAARKILNCNFSGMNKK